jgi:hypothetical protein
MTVIRLHRAQSEVITDLFGPNPDYNMRFEVVVGSRGLGKSYLAGAAVSLAASELESLSEDIPNKNITLICGTHTQVLDIYVPLLNYTFGLDQRSYKHSASQGRWYFPNGSTITCRSAEAIERLRGTGQYLIVGDEMPTWTVPNSSHETAWESVMAPCITTRWSPERARYMGAPSPGRALLIASPLSKDYFYELSQREVIDSRWKTRHYTYRDSPILDSAEIELERRNMDSYRFAREYEASFEDAGARVFHEFDRKLHVKTDIEPFDDTETVHASVDFNVMKNCTAFHAIRGNQIFTLGESQGTANTEELAAYIRARFPKNKVVCYPDPSGKARKTSSPVGQTDFSILRNAGFEVLVRSKAPPIVDSVNAVNRLFKNAAGEVNWYVSHECPGFIKSMERTIWLESRPDSAMIDKTMDVEHFGDGARYLAEYLYPVNHVTKRTQRGFAF